MGASLQAWPHVSAPGGLGGIGVEIARYLLKQHKVRLLLVGRTALPERDTWHTYVEQTSAVAQRIKDYLALEQLGEVIYQAVDVCDVAQLQRAVEQAKLHWQCELDGIIHLAGTAQECLLVDEGQRSFGRDAASKGSGNMGIAPTAQGSAASSLHLFLFGKWFLWQETTVGAYASRQTVFWTVFPPISNIRVRYRATVLPGACGTRLA